jgi:hypothetical protein
MGSAQGFGESKPGGESCACEPQFQIGKKRALAAKKVRHTADIEPEPIRTVGIQIRAIAARGPAGEADKSLFILLRGCGKGVEARTDGAGIGEVKACGETFALPCLVERGDEESPLFIADQRQRPVSRKGLSAARCPLPLQPLERKTRQKDGNETTHD